MKLEVKYSEVQGTMSSMRSRVDEQHLVVKGLGYDITELEINETASDVQYRG